MNQPSLQLFYWLPLLWTKQHQVSMMWFCCCGSVDPEGHNGGFCWPHHCATAATTPVPDAFSGFSNYAMGPLQVIFCVTVESSTSLLCWCLLLCWHSVSGCIVAAMVTSWDLTRSLHCYNPSKYTFSRHMCFTVMVHGPHPECTDWLLFQLFQVGGIVMLLTKLSPSHSIIVVGHTALWAELLLNSSSFPTLQGGPFSSRLCST